jgi:hypothetical protein
MTSWLQNGDEEVPGISFATLIIRCHNDQSFAIWTDMRGGFGEGFRHDSEGGHVDRNGVSTAAGSIGLESQVSYVYKYDPDGEQYAIFNERFFDLENGSVFLISTQSAEVLIEQVDVNITRLTSLDLQHLARTDSRIINFYRLNAPNN